MDISEDRALQPYRVGLLLINGFALMSYAAVIEPLRAANLLSKNRQFEVFHLGADNGPIVSSSGAVIASDLTLEESSSLDLLLVVAGGDPARFDDRNVLQNLRTLDRKGVVLGGVSGGPYILVTAGLMDGYRMTIHWEHAASLMENNDELLLERTLYVIDRTRMTCAGGTAPLDMLHALITRRCGASFARRVSDWFMHTDVRPSGGPQRAGLVERYGVNNPQVIQALEMMENHIADPLSLDQLAKLSDISVRQLNRLFANHLKTTTIAFYKSLRLEVANRLLSQSALTITQIALATGFANSAHFSKAYRSQFGTSPSSQRKGGGHPASFMTASA